MIRRIAVSLMFVLAAAPAHANEFYKGKIISIVTSTGAGGTYDAMARLFARNMGRHIAGAPGFVVRNMPGGGNVVATNYMYSIAPKDGLTIATVHNAMPLNQMLGGQGVAYQSDKFNWLGSTGPDNSVIFVTPRAGIKTLEEALQKEVVIGSTGAGSGLTIIPLAINRVLGTKFKVVIGYKSSDEINLALERGEVHGRTFSYSSIVAQHPQWIKEKKMIFLTQIGTKRIPELGDLHLVTELARNEDDRRVLELISSPPGLGQPYLAPPGVPPERVSILRRALADTMKDADFLAEARAVGMDVDPMSADEVERIVSSVINAHPDIVRRAKEAIAPM